MIHGGVRRPVVLYNKVNELYWLTNEKRKRTRWNGSHVYDV